MQLRSIFKTNKGTILLLFLVFICTELIINPIGNFPLNDDWVYGKVSEYVYQHHAFNPSLWGCTSMFAHIVYSQMFIYASEFSYTTLRFSTLVLSACGIFCFYLIGTKHLKLSNSVAFFVSLLLLFNPLYLCLSNSFMTDVPFLSTAIIGFYCYFQFNTTKKKYYFVLSVVFFSWCILIRQLGISFVMGVFLASIFYNKKLMKANFIFLISSLIPFFVFEYWYQLNIHHYAYISVFYRNPSSINPLFFENFFINFSKRWIHYISFTGLVLSPLLLPYLYSIIKSKLFLREKKTTVIALLLFVPVLWSLRKFPIGNYLYNIGIGPQTLYDTYILKINQQHAQSNILFSGMLTVCLLGSFSLLFLIVSNALLFFKDIKQRNVSSFVVSSLLVSLFFYYTFLAIPSAIFDRYIFVFSVFMIPFIINPKVATKTKKHAKNVDKSTT
jgi:hypothetical protein